MGQGGCEAASLLLSVLRTNNMNSSLSKFMDNLVSQLTCLTSVYIGGENLVVSSVALGAVNMTII